MSDDIFGALKGVHTSTLALRRELEERVKNWDRPGYYYRGGGDLLLKHGTFYTGRELPDQYVHLFGEPNACFNNAMEVSLAHPELRYCEGVYAAHGGFVPHAWCVAPDGGILELTWPTREAQGTERFRDSLMQMPLVAPERMAYCGVFFRPELILWFLDTYGEFCMLDRPEYDRTFAYKAGLDVSQCHDWPILKVPYDPDRVSL